MRRVCAWSGGPSEGANAQSLRVRSAKNAVKTEVHGFGIVKRPPSQTTGRRFVLRLVTCLFCASDVWINRFLDFAVMPRVLVFVVFFLDFLTLVVSLFGIV